MNRRSPDVLASRVAKPGRIIAAPIIASINASITAVSVAGVSLALLALPATLHATEIPSAIRTSPDVTTSVTMIQSYVEKSVKELVSDDAKVSSNARTDLTNNVGGITPPSGAFLDTYSSDLSKLLLPLVKNPNPRVRLNVAIVTAKVAEKTQDANFAPLVAVQLKDENEGVVLWGLKAARSVIPPAVSVPGLGKGLVASVQDAPKQHKVSGEILAAAYDALTPNPNPANTPAAAVAALVGPVQDLLAWRVQQFQSGPPVEPSVDAGAMGFLTDHVTWTLQKLPAQTRTLQLIVDLLAAANSDLATVTPADHDLLVRIQQFAGKALLVVGYNVNDPAFQAAMTPLASINARVAPAVITSTVADTIKAVTTKFSTVAAPKSSAATKPAATKPAA